ncbi:HlyD family type I secretion periplasmic adaptor subunit [Sphingomonas sp. ST-64]|uniref:Membrane fusion protein (MFP) family protein n=1 Tax=Sphingomonas plantiphila TaxID=3163295 RepID=A0ABW8YL73_9SPHN
MNAHMPVDAAPPVEPERPEGADDRLRRRTRHAFALIAVLLFGLFGLAAFLQIGGAVIGSGEVVVDSSVRVVSHPTGGVLRDVLVRNGDRVRQGQVLVRLDTTVTEIGSQSASTGLDQLLARRARLEAERDGAAVLRFPSELTGNGDARTQEVIAREKGLFDLRRAELVGTLALLRQRIEQLDSEIAGYRVQIDATERQLVLIEPELEGLRRLHEKQLVTINRLNSAERAAVQLEGSKAALQSNIAQARARISETREQILNVTKNMRSDAATQLADVIAQINEQQVRVASTADAVARSDVRAPQSGTVDKIAFTTVGSAVPPAQPILQIVPDRDTLVVEARIRPQDVDQVRTGQDARVTFSGLDRQTTPDIPGTVIFVSPELTRDDRTGMSFYRIRVRIDGAVATRNTPVALKAGMPAEVFVATGERSMLSYLVKPMIDQIRYAFREG